MDSPDLALISWISKEEELFRAFKNIWSPYVCRKVSEK